MFTHTFEFHNDLIINIIKAVTLDPQHEVKYGF